MILKLSYSAHEHLVSPARTKAQLWRLVVGLIIASGVYLICNQSALRSIFNIVGGGDAPAFYDWLQDGAEPLSMYILLFSFAFIIVGVAVAVRVVHDRHIGAVLGDWRLLVSQFRDVVILLVLLNVAVWVLPPWNWGAPFVSNLSLSTWMILLPFSILAVLVQVSAEEVLFRGYLQQQLAARFSSPWVWMILPAAIFGLGHYMPETDGTVAGFVALWAVVFGILMADLTARSGTLGPAIAVHLVNNVSAMMLVSLPDGLSGLALYLAPFSMADTELIRMWLPVDFGLMIVSWLAARLAIRR